MSALGIFGRIRNLFGPRGRTSVGDWFAVTFDEAVVRLRADPPGRPAWSLEFRWDAVIRVCFRAEGPMASDGVYVFTADRPESYAIPTGAKGGEAFWAEVLRRGLFDADLAIHAAGAVDETFCWPPRA